MKTPAESLRADRPGSRVSQTPLWIAAMLALLVAAGAAFGIVRASDGLAGDRRAAAAATQLREVAEQTRAAATAGTGTGPGSELDAAAALLRLEPAVAALERTAPGAARPVRAAFTQLAASAAAGERQIVTGQADATSVEQTVGAANQAFLDATESARVDLRDAANSAGTRFTLLTAAALAIAGVAAAALILLFARARAGRADLDGRHGSRYAALMQSSGDAVAVLDAGGVVREQSASMLRLLGRSDGSLIDRPFAEIVREADRPALVELLAAARANGGEAARGRVHLLHADGSERAFEVVASRVAESGGPPTILLTCHPVAVAPVQPVVAPAAAAAANDPVSGMLSAAFFRDRLEHALARSVRLADPVSLLLVDLGADSRVADLSPDTRAVVIRTIGGRIARATRTGDSIGHLGQVEIGVVLEDADEATTATIARRILDALHQPVAHLNGVVNLSPRIGIAIKADPRDNADTLLLDARASLARGADLSAGVARPETGPLPAEPQLSPAAQSVSAREAPIAGAANESAAVPDALDLHYLPTLALETGEIVEMETLARWRHPERGWVPLASSGMAATVLPRLIENACALVMVLPPLRNGGRVRFSINLTPETPLDDTLVDLVASTLLTTGADPGSIQLEFPPRMVDEQAPDYARTLAALNQLRELGVRLAVDGAGAEANRLPDLSQLPVQAIKIDRAVVTLLERSAERRALVRSLVERATASGASVCATGVETLEQAERLWDMGVDEGQGPIFFRPVGADQLKALFYGNVPQAAA